AGNTYRYASVYFVPLGFAKGWLKGSGGRPAARLFSFGNCRAPERSGRLYRYASARFQRIPLRSRGGASRAGANLPGWHLRVEGDQLATSAASGNPLRRAGWLRG